MYVTERVARLRENSRITHGHARTRFRSAWLLLSYDEQRDKDMYVVPNPRFTGFTAINLINDSSRARATSLFIMHKYLIVIFHSYRRETVRIYEWQGVMMFLDELTIVTFFLGTPGKLSYFGGFICFV